MATPTSGRLDVHHHVIPPAFERFAGPSTQWSAASTLSWMDDHRVAAAVMSVSAPGLPSAADEGGPRLTREINEFTAELVKNRPDRFGHFASLPMADHDPASVLDEVGYAFDTLQADGVVLMSNAVGIYLGDRLWEPVWEELDRRQAVVFIHPTATGLRPLHGLSPAVVDFPFDTARTAVDLVVSGVMHRHRHVKVILSHAGGFLPYAAQRFAGIIPVLSSPKSTPTTPDAILAGLKRFYFDTALSTGHDALKLLASFAEPGHVLYGSDWPYAGTAGTEYFNHLLDTADLTQSDREAIEHRNAELLFPRFAT
ncbi:MULTISPECIES: amidohydrolase family protein [Streptomyces]|uniref:amidohydrolase family protein n=1 Tax=Streptomyces TaxID=1883 RepID=UPI002E256B1E|nr:amidohydrolase [Streptomyces phaeochromogenes]